jgi:hypothetical protein
MVAWFFKDYALLEVTRPREVATDLTFLTDFYLILLVIYGKCTKFGFFYTYCRCKSINGHQFPIPHLSRRSDKRVEMGHRPRRRRSPLILSHMDVHTKGDPGPLRGQGPSQRPGHPQRPGPPQRPRPRENGPYRHENGFSIYRRIWFIQPL